LYLPHKFAVVVEVHWDVQVNLLLLLSFDVALHLAVDVGHVEIDLILFLDFDGINHLAVVVVVDGHVEVNLLVLLWLGDRVCE
jgi:hypothetical protein